MPYQQSYPVSQIADAYTNVTGYRTDPVSGKLTTVNVPVPFLYGGKWSMGVGKPTANGAGTGDSYLNVQNGDVYSWNQTTATWGSPVGTLINGTYQIPVWCVGKPLPNEVLYSLEAPGPFVAYAGMTDSVASADTTATAQTVFSLTQNGTQFATVTFAAGSKVGTVACPSQTTFVAGDIVNVVCPATPDATLSNIRMTLGFTRPSGAAASDIVSSGQAAASATQAATSASNALASANNAAASATTAQNWASQSSGTVDGTSYSAKYYSGLASTSATNASSLASAASTSASNASTSAGTATTQAGNASTSATNASGSATLAQNWASQASGVVNGTSYYSAYYYATQAANSASSAASSAASFPTAGRLLNVQVLTGSGTYTPTAGTNSVIVELIGGGAGSGGLAATSSSQGGISGSGSSGGYVRHRYTSGFSGLAYSVGLAGAGGNSGGGAGGNGGNTTFGALTAGGGHGTTGAITTGSVAVFSGATGTASGGNILNVTGNSATAAWIIVSAGMIVGTPQTPAPYGGTTYGYGGAGVSIPGSSAAVAGNAGGAGIAIVYEYS